MLNDHVEDEAGPNELVAALEVGLGQAVQSGPSYSTQLAAPGSPLAAQVDMFNRLDPSVQDQLQDGVWGTRIPDESPENATVGIFKVDPDGAGAARVQVKLGRGSVTTIEVIDGLKEGDVVILSDTTQWDNNDRIRIN